MPQGGRPLVMANAMPASCSSRAASFCQLGQDLVLGDQRAVYVCEQKSDVRMSPHVLCSVTPFLYQPVAEIGKQVGMCNDSCLPLVAYKREGCLHLVMPHGKSLPTPRCRRQGSILLHLDSDSMVNIAHFSK
jgi:hypothetical protein